MGRNIISLVYDNLSTKETIEFLDELACLINPVGCRELNEEMQLRWIHDKILNGVK